MIRRPTFEQIRDVASSLHMHMSEQEIRDYMELMESTFQAYDRVDELPDNLPAVVYPRTPGYRPPPSENPLNAWYVKTDIKGADRGPLKGRKIVIKDNICVAGVPMMNGASTLEGYMPNVDATLVTRILDAGGTIVGKAHCEYLCFSGGSHTSAHGPVHNPYKYGYLAGGSSSGCGALVGAGEVSMAIGGDQGGSIRIPSSFSGAYGMKPTHGLVPYSGVFPIESTIDHVGPITANVADNALLLEVIAGEDGLDPRQCHVKTAKYTDSLSKGASKLKIGVVKEGFGHANSEPDVDEAVRIAARKFETLSAEVQEISVPMHLEGVPIWTPIVLEGQQAQMMRGNGFGFNWKGLYMPDLISFHSNWRSRADELPPTLKISMLIGEYFIRQHAGRYYAKAQNLSRRLRKAYDDALRDVDLLVMPTLPIKAKPIPPPDAPLAIIIQRAFEMAPNTAPFDVTGHPAMSVPCGMREGLPIGMMLVGKYWDEGTIYQAAAAFEAIGDWRQM